MKLCVFDYVSTAAARLEAERPNLNKIAMRLTSYLEKGLESDDEVVGVTCRVKTESSLKEKIIRNSLYKQFGAEELIYKMSDVIGIRIECRFLSDEQKVYARLREIFTQTEDGRHYYPEGKKHLRLDFGGCQPQRQKNGLEIYRIDGTVASAGVDYNFELQIKSLVNSFWSEIEHKVIYKNKRFMMIDNFVNELMKSINQNLIGIDRQLNMLFNRCLDSSVVEQKQQVENMLTVFINDVYSALVEQNVGFQVSIKSYSESLVQYLLIYSSFACGVVDDEVRYGELVMNVMNWMRNIDFDSVRIGSEIHFDRPFAYDGDLERAVGEKFIASINADFYVNTFFHILFSLEVGNDAQDFMTFVRYYAKRIGEGKTREEVEKLKYLIAISDPSRMLLESGVDRLVRLVE